jgi:hypothetical protein
MILQRITHILMLAAAVTATAAIGEENSPPDDIKELQGINIVGNKEVPKSLFIIPWQTTEHEQNTSLTSNFSDSSMQPLDRESFQQQLWLHELGKSGWHTITADRP